MESAGDSDTPADIEQLQSDYPYWHVWKGVAGLLYARRLKSSPPKVVRADGVTALRKKIHDAEHPPGATFLKLVS